MRQMLSAMASFRDVAISPVPPAGRLGRHRRARIAGAFNQALEHDERISREVGRQSASVGRRRAAEAADVAAGARSAAGLTQVDSLNTLIDDLVRPTTEVARTIGAVAKGDLGQSMALEVDGRPLEGRVPALGEAGQQR